MNCKQARRLFGACWDDETTRAERDWLDSHFASCASCRSEYEEFSRVLELAGSLPRLEPSPDLVERVLARARRLAPAPDRVESTRQAWVPITAVAALIAIVGILAAPWSGVRDPVAPRTAARVEAVVQPQLRDPASQTAGLVASEPTAAGRVDGARGALAEVPDSLFDHSEDMEFILDPVTLRHGRASVARTPARTPDVQGERATITF